VTGLANWDELLQRDVQIYQGEGRRLERRRAADAGLVQVTAYREIHALP